MAFKIFRNRVMTGYKCGVLRYLCLLPLLFLITACGTVGTYETGTQSYPKIKKKVDYVLVDKSTNKMYLMKNDRAIRSYNVGFGGNPRGHKRQEGDLRTPEGIYTLTFKNYNSQFYKSIFINYPNAQDIARAQARGVSPGGEIVIHGMPNEAGNYLGPITPRNWTRGCIAVRNHEMDELFRLIDVPIPILIRP